MAKLKPCPFCGGEARSYRYRFWDGDIEKKLWLCQCESCRLNYPPIKVHCEHESEAIDAWNKREDTISVAEIEAYLQSRLDEWNALGDRKWEPANVWGYNFIMACFDDLERRNENG